jgi:hypothetical protein
VLWGGAAEREAALSRLMPFGPFEPDAPWDELPQAFMAMDAEHRRLLGTFRWVQRGEPRGLGNHLLELDDQWDRAVVVEPVEGQPKPPLCTKLNGWVTVLCLFAGIGAELEGLLQAGIRVRRLLMVEIDPVARRILEFWVRCLHRRYPDQLLAMACEGLLKSDGHARRCQAGRGDGAGEVHANSRDDGVVPLPRAVPRQPKWAGIGGPPVRADRQRVPDLDVPEQAPAHQAGLHH